MLPKITISEAAAIVLRGALNDATAGDVIHLAISARFDHELEVGAPDPAEAIQEIAGVPLCVEPTSLARADGLTIDYIDGPSGTGFRMENPNAPTAITELGAPDLKSRLDSKEIQVLVDVRTTWEREIASLPDSILLDEQSYPGLAKLPKDTPIAFYCHHGVRSRAAATRFLQEGFTKVYNLTGGIEAWSQTVDSGVARY